MLYSDDTSMDSTMGSDMDSTSPSTGRVFIKLCCMGRLLLSVCEKARKKGHIPPVYESETGKRYSLRAE